MKTAKKLFGFLAGLVVDKFYGTVTIRFECGKVTHVELQQRRTWRYKDLPGASSANAADSPQSNGTPVSLPDQFS